MARLLLLGVAVLAVPSASAAAPAPPATPRQQAVDRALGYLARAQKPDGSWDLRSGPGHPASTGLCVLAFLSAGHGPTKGPYEKTILRGILYVLASQRPEGTFGRAQFSYETYTLGICTWMLAEAYPGFPEDRQKSLRPHLERAIALILKAQRVQGSGKGGWRYSVRPGSDGDMSCSGWQMTALRAARKAGFEVPDQALDNALAFVDRCRKDRPAGYAYIPGGGSTTGCTAIALFQLALAGKTVKDKTPDVAGALDFASRFPARPTGSYFLYQTHYLLQAITLLDPEGKGAVRDRAVEAIVKIQAADGSWLTSSEGAFGRPLNTALAVLALTAQDRQLPSLRRKP